MTNAHSAGDSGVPATQGACSPDPTSTGEEPLGEVETEVAL